MVINCPNRAELKYEPSQAEPTYVIMVWLWYDQKTDGCTVGMLIINDFRVSLSLSPQSHEARSIIPNLLSN